MERVSGKTMQRFSIAGLQAASNLLHKASRALSTGDQERARALVDRAVRMPFDRHEGAHPAAFEVHMELFSLVVDELEDSSEDDFRWLEAAVEVLSTADEAGRYEVRDVLVAIDNDYSLSPRERATIRSAIAPVAARSELRDLQLGPAELRDHVLSILAACHRYRAAVEALAD